MKVIYRGLFLIVLPLFLGAHSCTKAENKIIGNTHNQADGTIEFGASCKQNDECTTIKADCCGCSKGGTQKAIAKDQAMGAKEELKSRCSGVMCIQVISNDSSCKKNSTCKSGDCVLE